MMNDVQSKPLVSVIMPTYNHADYIGEAIRSVLSQTHDQLELIIIDNYSTDDTESVVKTFRDQRIKYYRFDNRGIIASARNYGANRAQGGLLAFIDSDDLWVADKLSTQIKYMSDDTVSCIASDFTPIGDVMYCWKHLLFKSGEMYRDYSYSDMILDNPVMTSSAIIRTNAFREVGGFDEASEFRYIEDWELWLRMSLIGTIRVLSMPLIKYRIIRDKSRDARDVHLRTIKVLEKHKRNGCLSDKTFRSAYGNRSINIGKAHLNVNDRNGLRYFRDGFFCSSGCHNKIRAMIGIMMYYLPRSLRELSIKCLYRYRASKVL